jgi:hypothetical protein
MHRKWIAASSLFLAPWAFTAVTQKPIDFNRDIRPVLSDNCFACHGPDEQKRMAGLRLDTPEGALQGGAIVPGNSAGSKVIARITSEKKGMRMPPAATNKILTPAQIDLLKRWIDQGAKWESHWSFRPVVQPEVPRISNAKWVRNPIDAFVLARLDREGLKPSPEALRETLLRRVTLDLTGLPPTPAEVDSFLADKSPDAYEKRVDELLARPQHAERLAMKWLDLARYADTHGYHIDSHRDMWHWRDWVIDAFRRNLPYDQFTIQQIAGDLLPNPTRDQLMATGFNRNHMINYEGGAIPEEYLSEYIVDRVETTSTVWLGLTMGCARCHDHKYDPITQRDFYRFFAFFNSVNEEGLDGRFGNAKPILQLPDDKQKKKLDNLRSEISLREEMLCDENVEPAFEAWEPHHAGRMKVPSREGLKLHYEFENHLADTSGHYKHGFAARGDATYAGGMIGQSLVLSGETQVDLTKEPVATPDRPFTIAFWVRWSSSANALLQQVSDPESRRGFEILLEKGVPIGDLKRGAELVLRFTNQWPSDALEVRPAKLVEQNVWTHIAIISDGSTRGSGLKFFFNGQPVDARITKDSLSRIALDGGTLQIGNKALAVPYKGQIDDIRIYERALDTPELDLLAIHEPARSILVAPGSKSRDQRTRIREYFLKFEAPEALRNAYAELKELKEEKAKLDKIVPNTMIMAEMHDPRETHILARGDYRNKGEQVEPGTPSALPPLPSGAPANRLGVAQWLVDPAHPLTSRVAVNRFWQLYFGDGLVKTSQDFGSQGDSPTHPQLLDWLAAEFMKSSWNMRALERLILTSSTYRQSSQASRELLEKDPENRLYARGARVRLPAEVVRDNALAISGLLNPAIGGPSVFPYQPDGLWEEIAYGDVFTAQSYTPSHGKDLYRRSMYSFWKRTSPPPSLATFDAPDREKCTARRPRTNTPLQALVLMNDPTYVEAARGLAQRLILEAGNDPGKRITYAYRLALARKPNGRELQVLRDLAEQNTSTYRRNKEAALKLLAAGESRYDPKVDPVELAAWATVSSVILSLDETITKE